MRRPTKVKKTAAEPTAENRRQFVEHARAAREALERDYPPGNPTLDLVWARVARDLAAKYSIPMPDILQVPYLGHLSEDITAFMSGLALDVHAAQIIHDTDAERILTLDADWQAKASTYISHIREAVSRAEMREPLRERIFARLNALQGEIDRNRTRMESVTEVLLSLTEAVGKGAKNLTPALRLFERLAGALSGARTTRLGYEAHEALPAPENFGLIEDASSHPSDDE